MIDWAAHNTRLFFDVSILDLHTENRMAVAVGDVAEYPICGDTIADIRATA